MAQILIKSLLKVIETWTFTDITRLRYDYATHLNYNVNHDFLLFDNHNPHFLLEDISVVEFRMSKKQNGCKA